MARTTNIEDGIGGEESRAYVVDENTVFFYAGIRIDEDRMDRNNYKVFFRFEPEGDGNRGKVEIYTDNPAMKLQVNNSAEFSVYEQYDDVRPYLLHHYIIINNINYNFTDYTSSVSTEFEYNVTGSLTLERPINTQIPNEDQAIEW